MSTQVPTHLLGTGSLVQVAHSEFSAGASTSVAIPFDNTIPQNTEGAQFMTVSITPKSTSNFLIIDVVAWGVDSQVSGSSAPSTGAIFKDSDANALSATQWNHFNGSNSTMNSTFSLRHRMAALSTSAITFKFRAGTANGSTFYFNQHSDGDKFGGVASSTITVWEIAS